MSELPAEYTVEARLDWIEGHGDPPAVARALARELNSSEYTVVEDLQTGGFVLVSRSGDDG